MAAVEHNTDDSGTGSGPTAAGRRRDAAATRDAILHSAVVAFTRAGYDGVGVREIAQGAGVTAMLVNRYFGSKEQLFAEAVDVSFAPRTVVTAGTPGTVDPGATGDPGTLSRDIARSLTARTAPESDHLDPFLLMLRSASNPRAAEIMRAATERHVGQDLRDLLPGADATERAERAELVLSLITGVWMMRRVIGTTALADADPGPLARRIEAMLRVVVESVEDMGRADV
ncbi:TetR family transcriptional regulator [Streptomyces sp. NPDC059568]|uniref:TetR/AcrR family transcriptional regulator n=1 Tax=Streptomyces sp. NPDC059568 TaxID=3346868 RepID=UPI0036C968F5